MTAKTNTETLVILDAPTVAALRFVLDQAEQDRAAHLDRMSNSPTPLAPPPVPTFAEALAQAVRIGVRALSQGALQHHEQGDVPPNPGDDGDLLFASSYPRPFPRGGGLCARLAHGRGS